MILLLFSLPSPGQKKSPRSNVKDKNQAAKDDPWADYKEEKDSISRWEVGINLGGYFASKYPANFYNGTPGNINNVNYVMSNYYWYQDIKRLLNASTSVEVDGYPMNMHYHVAMTGGVYLRFNINRKNGIFIEANYTQLKADDIVTMKVDPTVYLSFDDIRLIPISGWEERAMLNLGYQRSFPLKSKVYFFANAALTMAYTHVKKSSIYVEGQEFSLINYSSDPYYIPNNGMQTNYVRQVGIGWGGMIGGGVGLPITDMFCLEPGVSMQYYPSNLGDYTAFRPSFSVYIRIMLGFSHRKVT